LRESGDNRGANIALAPNGLRVLHHVRVYDKIRTKGYNFETITTYNAQGQNLGRFLNGSETHYNFAALRIHRSLVHQGLLDEVKAQDIMIHNNMKLLAIQEETDSGVKLKFENGQTVEAEFVIGADGIHSKVRPYITNVDLVYSGYIGIIGLSVPKDRLHEYHKDISFPAFTFGKSGFVAMLPSNYDGTVVDFFSIFPFPSQDREYWDDFMMQRDKQQKMLIERFGGDNWPPHIRKVVKEQTSENLNGHP
jgi:2-polyprenyl-6-methoxyphenol hydroxylase-like FAD-dependent oxidoreductase